MLRIISLLGLLRADYLLAGDVADLPRVDPQTVPASAVLDFGMPSAQIYALIFVGAFGVITLLVQAVLLWRATALPSEAMRLTLITLITTLAVGSLVMGYSDRQIAPVMALFGSIVGYLLGRDSTSGAREARGDKTDVASGKEHSS